MSDLIVALQKVLEVRPHPNADRLEVAVVLGWEVVTQKGNVQAGDTVLYVPPDAMLPKELAEKWGVAPYLAWHKGEEKGKVRAASIRSFISYGFIVPDHKLDIQAEIGEDLKEHFGIDKYEPPERLDSGEAEKENFLFHKYTDIQRIENFPEALIPGEEVVATEKIHGCLKNDTKVTLANGEQVRIDELEVGTMVLSYDIDSGCFVPSEVLEIIIKSPSNQDPCWLKLSFIDSNETEQSIICTEDHLILTNNRGWVPAGLLTEEDDVLGLE